MQIKPHIIAVSYAYTPINLPQSILIQRLLKGVADKGYPITLFRAAPHSSFGRIDNTLQKIKSHPGIMEISVNSFSKNPFILFLYMILPFIKNLPDNYNSWVLPTYFAIKKYLKKNGHQNTVLCTFSNPWSDHVIGLLVQRNFSIPWLAHFSDPWSLNPFFKWNSISTKIQNKLELSTLKKCGKAVFVSEETRQLFESAFNEILINKTAVLNHSMAPEISSLLQHKVKNQSLTISYIGDFYGFRTPHSLLKALRNLMQNNKELLKHLKIQFIGKSPKHVTNQITTFGLNKLIIQLKPVPYFESLKHMVNSDILLLVDGKVKGKNVFFPSKLVEYLGTGNTIFGITPTGSCSSRIINQYGGVTVDPENIHEIEEKILSFINDWKTGGLNLSHKHSKSIQNEFSVSSVASNFISEINVLTQ